jgi:hypothetical protein
VYQQGTGDIRHIHRIASGGPRHLILTGGATISFLNFPSFRDSSGPMTEDFKFKMTALSSGFATPPCLRQDLRIICRMRTFDTHDSVAQYE